jgi:hypothetical protein
VDTLRRLCRADWALLHGRYDDALAETRTLADALESRGHLRYAVHAGVILTIAHQKLGDGAPARHIHQHGDVPPQELVQEAALQLAVEGRVRGALARAYRALRRRPSSHLLVFASGRGHSCPYDGDHHATETVDMAQTRRETRIFAHPTTAFGSGTTIAA